MPVTCPSCSADVPGAVSRDVLAAQVKAKTDEALAPVRAELSTLKGELKTAQAKAAGFESVTAELATVKGELTRRDQQSERTAAMGEAGISGTVELAHLEMFYNSATAGAEDAPSFADWLKSDGVKHPLVAPHVKAAGDTTGSSTTQTTQATGSTVAIAPGSDPGGTGGKLSSQQLADYFAGAEFQGLEPAAKRARLAELESQHRA